MTLSDGAQRWQSTFFDSFSCVYRLTESTSSIHTPTESKQPARRAEPTEEAKVAGQAALARLEAQKNDKPRFNTYA